MKPKHAGGRPPADPRAVRAWQTHRLKARPLKLFAARLNISQPAISKWRQVPEDKLEATAEFLGLQPADLRPDLQAPAPMPWAELLNT